MVDFGDTIFEGSLKTPTPIVNPVEDKSGLYLAQGLSSTMDNINSLFEGRAAAKAEAAKGAIFNEISDKILLYADAREQGISTDEIMRHLRKDTSTWTANNPELTEDIWTFVNKTLSDNGLGGNINKETPVETGNRKLIEEAVSLGWNPSDIGSYVKHKGALTQLQMTADTFKAQTEALTAPQKYQAAVQLQTVISTGIPWVQGQITQGMDQLQNITDPVARQEIINKVKANVAQQTAFVGNLRTASGDAFNTSYLTDGVDLLMKEFEEVANGTRDLAALETKSKLIQAKYEAIALADPKIAALMMTNKATNYADYGKVNELATRMVDLYASLGAPSTTDPITGKVTAPKPPDLIESADQIIPVLDTVQSEIANLASGVDVDPEAVTAENARIADVLKSIEKYGSTENETTNFNAVIKFLSDPTVGQYMEKNAGEITALTGNAARYVIEQQYDAVVLPLINERWTQASEQIKTSKGGGFAESIGMVGNQQVGTEEFTDINKVIEPYWNGNGIEFRVVEEFKNDANLRGIAKSLNQGQNAIAPVVNQLIRTSAHMTGSTDYEKIYNENYKARLWQVGDEDIDSNLELDDFIGGYEEPIPEEQKGKVKPQDAEGLMGYLVEGKPDSYITDMDPDFAVSLNTMLSEVPPELKGQILINSGARSYQKQKQLWEAALKKYGSESKARKWVAPPGQSNHNHGIAADLYYATPAARDWVHQNAATYGLRFPLGNEPWHIEPKGARG